MNERSRHWLKFFEITGLSALLLAALVLGGLKYWRTAAALSNARTELASTTSALDGLETEVAALKNDNLNLSDALIAAQNENASFADQLSGIQYTIQRLDKLSKTDRELLKKYSKVYFLNENYVPESLADITSEFSADGRTYQFHSKALPYLETMVRAASADGKKISITSAYRSFAEQMGLKSAYAVTYGSGANKFSADQGYSEHQLGTTVDFTAASLGGGLVGFDKTEGFAWLKENAHKYGFILSYPKGNAYYMYEPWHWRFVGVKLAAMLHNEGINFYDADQRKIDNYLITIFD